MWWDLLISQTRTGPTNKKSCLSSPRMETSSGLAVSSICWGEFIPIHWDCVLRLAWQLSPVSYLPTAILICQSKRLSNRRLLLWRPQASSPRGQVWRRNGSRWTHSLGWNSFMAIHHPYFKDMDHKTQDFFSSLSFLSHFWLKAFSQSVGFLYSYCCLQAVSLIKSDLLISADCPTSFMLSVCIRVLRKHL